MPKQNYKKFTFFLDLNVSNFVKQRLAKYNQCQKEYEEAHNKVVKAETESHTNQNQMSKV